MILDDPLFSSSTVLTSNREGVRGQDIPVTGTHGPSILAQYVTLPADNDVLFSIIVDRFPSVGVLTMNEDGSFIYDAPDGTNESFDYRAKEELITIDTETETLSVGVGYTINLESGAYTSIGTDLTLDFDAITNFSITLESGSYTLQGTDTNLLKDYSFSLDSGEYTLTGADLDLSTTAETAFTILLESGTYSLQGDDIAFSRFYGISLESGSYSVTGTPLDLNYMEFEPIVIGKYTITFKL